MHSAHTFKLNH